MKRVIIVVSHPGTAQSFLGYQLAVLSQTYRVSVVANAGEAGMPFLPDGVRGISVRLERRPAPLRDAVALFTLYRLFRRERFDVVHSMTPNAGLLAMLAAFASRTPVRLHTFMGEVWSTRQGWSRSLLKASDRLVAMLATEVMVVSPSERSFLRAEGVLGASRGIVLAEGSHSGVDTARFEPDPTTRKDVRAELGIDDEDVVFLFLGRLTRDKGVIVLARAWQRLVDANVGGRLVLVGWDEEGLLGLPLFDQEGLVVVGPTLEPERYVKASDVLCLPSRREGFGNVVIEAASAGVPAIASRIYGLSDAVVDGETGLLFERDDVDALTTCMLRLMTEPGVRRALGEAARKRAVGRFSQEIVAAALIQAYDHALG
jgi:glycosyltransferase involved in cell wall biosynthesis